jgi:hypothetical protein
MLSYQLTARIRAGQRVVDESPPSAVPGRCCERHPRHAILIREAMEDLDPPVLATAAGPLPWLKPQFFFLGMLGISIIVMLVSTCGLYTTSGPLPPPRPAPPLAEKSAVTSYRYKDGFFRGLIDESAKRHKLSKEQTRGVWRRNSYFAEFTGEQQLRPGGNLETTHLKLDLTSEKIWVGEEGQGYRTEHLVLQITNRTDLHLAYRVITEVSGRCGGKGIVNHNAIALKPRETISRTECLQNGAGPVVVKRVEVLEISPLGYYYVSQLDPSRLRYDRRTSEGHQGPPGLSLCRLLPWRLIENQLSRGEARWYDVVDFYSRHSCDEYTYFAGYRWLEKDPKLLPVKPPGD